MFRIVKEKCNVVYVFYLAKYCAINTLNYYVKCKTYRNNIYLCEYYITKMQALSGNRYLHFIKHKFMKTKLSHLDKSLVGNYKIINSYTIQHQENGLKLVIGKNYRDKTTDKVLLYYPDQSKTKLHISKLMHYSEDVFYFDTFDKYFLLVLNRNNETAAIFQESYTNIVNRKCHILVTL